MSKILNAGCLSLLIAAGAAWAGDPAAIADKTAKSAAEVNAKQQEKQQEKQHMQQMHEHMDGMHKSMEKMHGDKPSPDQTPASAAPDEHAAHH